MKKLLCLFVLVLPLSAATETASVTVPNSRASQLATIVEVWIQAQLNPDGSLKYAGATQAQRRQALLNAILRDGVRRVIRQACEQFPADCPSSIKTEMDNRSTANAGVDTEIDDTVQ